MLLTRTDLCFLGIVDYLKRSLAHINPRKLFYWLWDVYAECLSWSVAKNIKRVMMYSLLGGLNFQKESIVKWSDGESRWVLWVLFSEATAANSQIFFLFFHSPVGLWRSRVQWESWLISGHGVISALFHSISVLTSLGPFWYASSFTRPQGLEGFSSDGDITHRITSMNTGSRSYWQESNFSE